MVTEYTVGCPHCDCSMEEEMLPIHEPHCIANPKNQEDYFKRVKEKKQSD